MKRIVTILSVAFVVMLGTLVVPKETMAASRTEVYIEVGESYNVSTKKVSSPVIDALSSDEAKIVSTKFNAKKTQLTVKGLKAGTAVFYVNKNNTKNENRVITVKVHVIAKASSQTAILSNSISHAVSQDSNKANQTVYIYSTRGVKFTTTCNNLPTSVSGDTSGKAKVFTASSIYEVKDSAGNYDGMKAWYLKPTTGIVSNSRSYTAGNVQKITTTYVRTDGYWTSSNGRKHWTKTRVVPVKVYKLPTMQIYEGTSIVSSLSMVIGTPRTLTYSLSNIENDTVKKFECSAQDKNKVDVKIENGKVKLNPLAPTNGSKINIIFNIVLDSEIASHNGSSYVTFTKYIPATVGEFSKVDLVSAENINKGIKLTWTKNENAVEYKVYRASNMIEGFKCIGKAKTNYYVDETAKYNVDYTYKVTAVSQNSIESDYSNNLSGKREVLKPTILKIEKVSQGLYKISITGDKYDGFEIYSGDNKKPLVSTDTNNATVRLNYGNYKFYVRAFVKEDGTKIYSQYSDAFTKKIVNPKKENATSNKTGKSKINNIKRKGKKAIVKLKKVKGVSGYEIVYYVKGHSKAKRLVTTKKSSIKVKVSKKAYCFKVRTFKKNGSSVSYSGFSKVKILKKKK